MRIKLIFFIGFSVLSSALVAQNKKDSIILLNGKVFRGDIKKVENQFIFFDETNKKGSIEQVEMSTYRVFSYVNDGTETVLYTPDEFKGDFLTVGETKNTTLGSYDARKMFRPRVVFWSSFLLGLGASVFDTYFSQKSYDALLVDGLPPPDLNIGFFGSKPSVFPFTIPLVLSVSWGLPSFKIKDRHILQRNLIGNDMYYRGFHRIAKQKRIFAALKGGLLGIGTGMIAYSILKIN